MSDGASTAFDDATPLDIGYLSDDFGIVFPSNNGFSINMQTGGVSCHQLKFNGVFYPLGRPRINRGFPDWMPRADRGVPHGEKHPIVDVDLSTIPDRDYETLQPWVQDRGHFYNWDEFSSWLDQDSVWRYGWIDLVDELQQWNYAPTGIDGSSTAPDMTERWDSLDDIWNTIDDVLGFTYDVYDDLEAKLEALRSDTDFTSEIPDGYPGTREGIRWIRVTGSKTDSTGNFVSPWAEQMKGELVILSYPNCD